MYKPSAMQGAIFTIKTFGGYIVKLVIDLEKGRLNTAKLVKKPVQVRGKDGKVHTRMQWTKPGEDPTQNDMHTKVDDTDHTIIGMQEFKNPYLKDKSDEPIIQASEEEKALKETVDAWHKKVSKTDNLYKMLKHLGLSEDGVDPRTIPELSQKEGNGMAPIIHMRNMVKFKKTIMNSPELMDTLNSKFSVSEDTAPKTTSAGKPKAKSKAQKGDNSIKGILDSMSREEKYDLMSRLGIADIDPANIDKWSTDKGDGSAPIRHMRNAMALKKKIELDPSILNIDPLGAKEPEEEERLKDRDDTELVRDKVTDFLNSASVELKKKWASDFVNHPDMKNRVRSDSEKIDHMHRMSALKKILSGDDSLIQTLTASLENEQLRNFKIGNKNMQKVLIHAVGLKGVGDVKIVEKGVEWEFGESSFARIDEDDDGKIILSIVDTGRDGEGWEEHTIPMSEVRDYLESLKSGNKSSKVTVSEVPLHKKLPSDIWSALKENFDGNYTDKVGETLQPLIGDAWILTDGGSGNIMTLARYLSVDAATLSKVLESNDIAMGYNGKRHEFNPNSEDWKQFAYKHLIDGEKTKNATDYLVSWMGDGMKTADRFDTYVLHESAKLWTPEQRTTARKEFIDKYTNIVTDKYPTFKGDEPEPVPSSATDFEKQKYEMDLLVYHKNKAQMDLETRKAKIVDHIHKSIEFVPFDLLTDVFAGGATFNFSEKEPRSNHYNPYTKGISMGFGYISDSRGLSTDHPSKFRPTPEYYSGRIHQPHPMMDTASHEFAHAVDHYLSNYENFGDWKVDKYKGSHHNPIRSSYDEAVTRSNPDRQVGTSMNGDTKYAYHKDEWMSYYEGRIYDPNYRKDNMDDTIKTKNGISIDTGYDTNDHMRGNEHFSENTSRFANAFHQYKEYNKKNQSDIPMRDWAKKMAGDFKALGYGDHSNEGQTHKHENGQVMLQSYLKNQQTGAVDHPMEAYGYLLHTMSERHPIMYDALHEVFGRGDFVPKPGEEPGVGMKESYENGDFSRKSMTANEEDSI